MLITLGRGFSPTSCLIANASLKTIISSCVFDLDGTCRGSYNGGQVWANLVTTPADGAAQSAYDMWLGVNGSADTSDPTFVGAPGSPSAYFLLDGGDVFRIKGGNTAFLESLHKSTGGVHQQAYSLAFALSLPTPAATVRNCSTQSGGSTSNGVDLRFTTSRAAHTSQGNGTTGVATSAPVQNVLPNGAPALVLMTMTANGAIRWRVNTRTSYAQSIAYNDTISAAAGVFTIGGNGNTPASSTFLPNGTKIYAYAMFNTALSDSELDQVIDVYNARHGRTYA